MKTTVNVVQIVASCVLQISTGLIAYFVRYKAFTMVHVLPFLTFVAQLGLVPIYAKDVSGSPSIVSLSVLHFFAALVASMTLFYRRPYQIIVIMGLLVPYLPCTLNITTDDHFNHFKQLQYLQKLPLSQLDPDGLQG